jgi:NADPH:quinone reductase-like Zn-dependent oxidoreductase
MLHFIRVRLINNWVTRVEACSVNPIDMKVRAGTYDDYPGMYPSLQVIGTVLRVNNFKTTTLVFHARTKFVATMARE